MSSETARMRAWGKKRTRIVTRTRHSETHTEGKGRGLRQTSDKVSSLAARYLTMDLTTLMKANPDDTLRDIRTLAASALSQDEHKGKRR